MVKTAFGNQAVEDVVGKAVACTVFIGEADQAAGFVVMVAEGMAQRIGNMRLLSFGRVREFGFVRS
ncbi:secretion chaperone CsaA [Neisseria macacae ATCC 33926]|uniref:Secretion chaperone CsaA n=1 Tax=Neisseria macacae ATCC 33926 TaxID=997348 RepID=A0AA36UGF4_9NEIS|nr:secretion chaperone CsaA [Neisseria macacae ATCC 33926]